MAQRVLVTGASGQVGGEIVRLLRTHGGSRFEVHAPGRGELDLSDPASIRAAVRALRPSWILNPGAYTAVDQAESERELAYAVNAEAPRALGEEAEAIGAAVVHFSTDYVFSGSGDRPWTEDDPTGPLGVYGASKLAGEEALLGTGAAAIILRTGWVYGATGKNFLVTILKLARARQELRIVDDQYGAPTWSRDLARLTLEIMARADPGAHEQPASAVASFRGVYHAGGQGRTSWFGFAQGGIGQMRLLEAEVPFAQLVPIPTTDYPTPARRPVNSCLDSTKLEKTFGRRMMDWHESLKAVIAEIAANASGTFTTAAPEERVPAGAVAVPDSR